MPDPAVVLTVVVAAAATILSASSLVGSWIAARRSLELEKRLRIMKLQLPDGFEVDFKVPQEATPHDVGEAVEKFLSERAKQASEPPPAPA